MSEPMPVLELAIGTCWLIGMIFVHGAGLRKINRQFRSVWSTFNAKTTNWQLTTLLTRVVGSFVVLHLLETLLWAVPIFLSGIIPSLRDSYYYVLESYTTLGEGSVSLPDAWRLIGPMIAMSGLFTFGWTGSVLVGVMGEFDKLDNLRSEKSDDSG